MPLNDKILPDSDPRMKVILGWTISSFAAAISLQIFAIFFLHNRHLNAISVTSSLARTFTLRLCAEINRFVRKKAAFKKFGNVL